MKTRYSAVLLVLLSIAGFSIAHAGPAEEWLKKTQQSEGDEPHTISEIEEFLKIADPIVKEGSDNPVFWYVLGIYSKRQFGDYYKKAKHLGTYSPANPESQALVKKYSFYYRNAIDADDNPDAPVHLGADELISITNTTLMDSDVVERSYKKQLELAQAGKADVENENYEYTTYEFLLESYSDQKNPEKYIETINEMIERFPNTSRMEELLEYKRQAEVAIEKRDREAAGITDQQDVYAVPEPKAVVKEIAVVKKVPQVEQSTTPTVEKNGLNLWLLIGGGIVLLGVIVLLMRRKKN